jgi:hypothetical protein
MTKGRKMKTTKIAAVALAVAASMSFQGAVAAVAAPSTAVTGASAYYRADLGYMIGWTAPAARNGITGYTVVAAPGGKTCKVSGATAVKCVYPASALTYGTAYTFSVISDGVGSISDPTNTVVSATIPNAPLYVASKTVSDTQVDVTWVPSPVTGGLALYGYKVTYWESDAFGEPVEVTRKEILATTTAASLSGLKKSAMYVINVASCNAYGCNSANTWSYAATTPNTPELAAIKLPTVISGGSARTKCFDSIFDAVDGVISSGITCPSVVVDPAKYPVIVPGGLAVAQAALATRFSQTAVLSGLAKNYSMTTWSATGGVNWFAYFIATSKSPVLGFTTKASVESLTPAVCAVSGSWIQFKAVGTCTISGSVEGNNVFLPAKTAKVSFTISK